MTSAHLTAGLSVQDTSTAPSGGTSAWLTAGLSAAELPFTGYRLYVGKGGFNEIDFAADPALLIPSGQSSGELIGYGFAASSRYTLVLRPVIEALETPDISCRCEFETDTNGQWLGVRPDPVENLSTELLSGGQVGLSWTYRTAEGGASPDDFCIYHALQRSIAASEPQAVVSYQQDGLATCTLSLVGGRTYFFAVTARNADGVESHLSSVVGPIVADSTAPASPTVILTATL